jgi:hypothetical protein
MTKASRLYSSSGTAGIPQKPRNEYARTRAVDLRYDICIEKLSLRFILQPTSTCKSWNSIARFDSELLLKLQESGIRRVNDEKASAEQLHSGSKKCSCLAAASVARKSTSGSGSASNRMISLACQLEGRMQLFCQEKLCRDISLAPLALVIHVFIAWRAEASWQLPKSRYLYSSAQHRPSREHPNSELEKARAIHRHS